MDGDVRNKRRVEAVRMWMHAGVIAIALFILLASMVTFVIFSFSTGTTAGLRSLAAAILPFATITYLRLFTKILRPRRQTKMPVFNLYFIFTVWTVFLFGFTRSLYGFSFPLGELMFSITLAATVLRYNSHSVKAFISCCYGIITGSLVYIIFAGFPFVIQ
ncbi:hypothetical protein IQ260_23610 [Leptolyngbya cf. ectocarpi LEGE 11479]|uniref:Tripartite tricarboxylate transporter TctB family protein n=1 Tax=Leptolyngbya cf. ectocarpi LEGE 11479 TaxID=1828722 RepID=A0A929FC21_LEPEC|nr:hypothetical protein [Leptolyngbya ectocarpi]MBE9069637.1 hypothetical protein [Leptolyngbya cf. ectocarpi LEGE 11479]